MCCNTAFVILPLSTTTPAPAADATEIALCDFSLVDN